jgi:uncharacterized LabA/DUF88 family protein
MAASPSIAQGPLRTYVYVDGANLFNSAKRRFGYMTPNCDIAVLARAIAGIASNRKLERIFYYIGVPKLEHDARNHNWWNKKLSAMGRSSVTVIRRNLKQRELTIKLSGVVHHESTNKKLIEKGIDLRLGLDLVKHARLSLFDLAIVFSQDGDLAEAVDDAYEIAQGQHRRISIECAFPVAADHPQQYGIKRTTTREFDKVAYDACIDPTDYNV